MLFDSIPGKNLACGRELFPKPSRHGRNDDNTIGFTDGHVQSVFQKDMSGLLWPPHLTTIPYAPDTPSGEKSSKQAPTGK